MLRNEWINFPRNWWTYLTRNYWVSLGGNSAGLTPQERAQFDKDTRIGVAEALSKIVMPTTFMSGAGGGKESSLLESILGAKLLNNDKK